jgi:hypothetical protein
MLQLVSFLFVLIGLNQATYSAEVYDTNIKVKCSATKNNFAAKKVKDFSSEEIFIEIKKIDWNKDSSKPPLVGSMSNIKIKIDAHLYEASLLLSTKKHLAFSFVSSSKEVVDATLAHIYELDMEILELKKTSVSLFNQSNKILTSVSYCKKQ